MDDCIFCKFVARQVPTNIVWENDSFMAFLDINPINPGHLLIIPKQHIGYVFDLDENLYPGLFDAAKILSAPLKAVTNAKRIGIALEGFGVDHVHLHLVPLHHGNELNPERAKPASKEGLEEMAGRIKIAIES